MPVTVPRTMIGLRKLEPRPGLTLCHDIPTPRIQPDEVLVEVTHAGVCGTDRHIYEWDPWAAGRVSVGITTGHEFTGRIVELGREVQRFAIGQRISAECHIPCERCHACLTDQPHVCERLRILGIDRDGGFANYVAVPQQCLWRVHDDIPDHHAAIFDPLGNAMHTVTSAPVRDRHVLITGAGTIGLMAIPMARHLGASHITVTDPSPDRRDRARKLGADLALDASDPDWPDHLIDATSGRHPDALLEMSGHPRALQQAIPLLAHAGTAALLGLPNAPLAIDLSRDVILKGIHLIGVHGRRIFETWQQVQDFLLAGRIDLSTIITHTLPLTQFEQAFRLMQTGEAVKIVFTLPPPQE